MVETVKINYAEEFRSYLLDNYGRSREEVEAIWFKDSGCFPEEYIGEDLMVDIINKFYEPLDFVRHLLTQKKVAKPLDISITVMPSYMNETFYVITYKGQIVLEENGLKAWKFWFERDRDFNEWVEETLKIWEERIQYFENLQELKAKYLEYQEAETDEEVEDAYKRFMRACEKLFPLVFL